MRGIALKSGRTRLRSCAYIRFRDYSAATLHILACALHTLSMPQACLQAHRAKVAEPGASVQQSAY